MNMPAPKRGWSPLPDVPDTHPWYRQFWPWALIGLPMSAVVAGFFTLYLAMHDPDGLVEDDYYRAGLAINQRLERSEQARILGLGGRATIDRTTGGITLDLASTAPLPENGLRLRLLYATRAQHDHELTLQHQSNGRYVGALDQPLIPGNWDVDLLPADKAWRITGRMWMPKEGTARVSVDLAP